MTKYLYILARARSEMHNGGGELIALTGQTIAYAAQYPSRVGLMAHAAWVSRQIGPIIMIGDTSEPAISAAVDAGRWCMPAPLTDARWASEYSASTVPGITRVSAMIRAQRVPRLSRTWDVLRRREAEFAQRSKSKLLRTTV